MAPKESISSSRPSVAELAAQLQQALDTALAQNERLAQQITEFEERAETAERRACETKEKLKILESLKTKEYQTVVTELFEGPSRRAVKLTLIVAVASIAIGLAQTTLSSIYAARANDAAVVRFATSLRSELQNDINRSALQTKQDVDIIVAKMLRDGTAESRAAVLTADVRVEGLVRDNDIKYYQIEVPRNVPRLQVVLTYQETKQAHAHVYVRHQTAPLQKPDFNQGYKTSEECVNKHPGSPDRCVFDQPRSGLWLVEVHGLAPSSPFQLSTSLRSDSGDGVKGAQLR